MDKEGNYKTLEELHEDEKKLGVEPSSEQEYKWIMEICPDTLLKPKRKLTEKQQTKILKDCNLL